MAPETRTRGAPPEGRVYHSTPMLKQSQFPSRKKIVRTYGKNRKRQENVALKQQTLTQIDFVSSFSEDPVQLSDSESEKSDDGRERRDLTNHSAGIELAASPNTRDNDAEYDSPPRVTKRRTRPSSEGIKRKRASINDGGELLEKKPALERQETIPSSTATSRYHTQTLTQFLGRDSPMATSESGENVDRGFLDWLGEPHSPSTGNAKQLSHGGGADTSHQDIASDTNAAMKDSWPDREESVIPQTPVKPKDAHIGLTSPRDVSTASTVHIERYHRHPCGINRQAETVWGNPAALVIEDSFATESWNSETPTRRSQRYSHFKENQDIPPLIINTTPRISRLSVGSSKHPIIGSPKSTLKGKRRVGFNDINLVEFASQRDHVEIPDSEDEDEEFHERDQQGQDTFVAGAETQLVLEELAFVEHQLQSKLDSSSKPSTPSVSNMNFRDALPPASARSDIILPIFFEALHPIIAGYEVNLCVSHKIPKQVVRFWLFDGSTLRYMACVEPGKPCGPDWAYVVEQMYELNNPVTSEDMQEEGWVDGQIRRYAYLPPAVVGQLLWNLRHAIFDNTELPDHSDDEGGAHPALKKANKSQIQHDVGLSTRILTSDNETPISNSNASHPNTVSPSESLPRQPNAPIGPSHAMAESLTTVPEPQLHPEYLLSSSLIFQDHGGSAVIPPHDIQFDSSQLLTKSQMLPDSLVQDGPGLPQEIWDSDDDVGL
ncbi:hypothetical protein PT974_11868 [Cladobotryum mycophilum]|uniref:Uncharacterized protein n=1 Tax=Cladobotryum mycophilum TaxID=491253 RepID=A0ABR0S7I3_9HYPO